MSKSKKKKNERRDICSRNLALSKRKVLLRDSLISSNWFNFLKADGKSLKKFLNIKDVRKHNSVVNSKDTSNQPIITKVLSLDCEMVSDMYDKDMLGRVSVVNFKLQCVYDKFVKPSSPVGDYRTRYSGIRKSDLENGVKFEIVQKEIKNLLKDKILVGHALSNDFKVLKFGHHRKLIRDTSKYELFQKISDGQSPSLKNLASKYLGEKIQEGEHDSVEDAKTAMKLYIKYRHGWEKSLMVQKTPNESKLHVHYGIKDAPFKGKITVGD